MFIVSQQMIPENPTMVAKLSPLYSMADWCSFCITSEFRTTAI
jgi:hypothetical protein